ncbi:MAG: YbjN domain-containing protein [Pseudomonadota bacterium]
MPTILDPATTVTPRAPMRPRPAAHGRAVGAAALAAVAPLPAPGDEPAQARVRAFIDGEAMAALLGEAGCTTELDRDDAGHPIVHSAASGWRCSIYFYHCAMGSDCRAIQDAARFESDGGVSAATVNDWNMTLLYGSAHLRDGDVWLEYDVKLDGGVTDAYLTDTAVLYEELLVAVAAHIDFD